uniref:Photosystem II protein PSII10 n=1 Tax=Gymnochlora stellata TaxID=67809 RepID=B5A4J4_GYMST|nr:photosystem II protein PSII10 [Gymnochlora stellata]
MIQAPMRPARSRSFLVAAVAATAVIALFAMTSTSMLGYGARAGIRSAPSRTACFMKVKKVDIKNQGLNSIGDATIQANLQGRSRAMENKGWVDSQGRKGKGLGVYRFEKKYGANVDGYSPIYTPDIWAESGNSYKLGTNALIAWAGLVVVLLAIGANLIISTSQL